MQVPHGGPVHQPVPSPASRGSATGVTSDPKIRSHRQGRWGLPTFVIQCLFLDPPHSCFRFGSVISSCEEKERDQALAGHPERSQRAPQRASCMFGSCPPVCGRLVLFSLGGQRWDHRCLVIRLSCRMRTCPRLPLRYDPRKVTWSGDRCVVDGRERGIGTGTQLTGCRQALAARRGRQMWREVRMHSSLSI